MTIDDRFSAWLDGELDAVDAAAVEADIAADADLAAEVDALRRVRSLLREHGSIALRADAPARMIARVHAADAASTASPAPPASVVSLGRRRRVPTFAAVAASIVIIASVVGGVGGSTTLPAVGDLIARHDAAAADMPHDPMDAAPDDMPVMDGAMDMMHAADDGGVVHAVYATKDGSVISVFRQDGELDAGGLVDDLGGSLGDMDGHAMWASDIGDRHIAVVDGDGYVWTIVSDVDGDPMADMMDDMMHDLPERSPGIGERLRDLADAIVEPFRLGG